MVSHVLFESASGYAIFQVKFVEDIGAKTLAMQESIKDLAKFGKMVSLQSFSPFKSAAQALENANDISEGIVNDHLKALIELNLTKGTKKSPVTLAVADTVLASNIKNALKINCEVSERGQELLRGIRLHATKLLKGLQGDDLKKAQLGLGHSYSRAKLKFNVNRVDNMIIQAIALLDQLDKDVNLFSMRIREWYGYHFPELVKLVPDNQLYARVAQFIGDKETLTQEKMPDLISLLDDDSTLAQNVLDAARGSMGSSLTEIDMLNISSFAARVTSLSEYRKSLVSYLSEKMNQVAPSLTALLGERIGARLISHAGSLTNLSKYPASTVQILGAEKALFRALKTKGNTPKYGLLYHSTFIGRAGPKHKGRISRFLANKCSIAARIDCYADNPTPKFGEALRNQIEERLNYFDKGEPTTKNSETMRKVLKSLALEKEVEAEAEDSDVDMDAAKPALTTLETSPSVKKDTKRKKRKSKDIDTDGEDEDKEPKPKKLKLSKEERKALKKASKVKQEAEAEVAAAANVVAAELPKKDKKKDKTEKKKQEKDGDKTGENDKDKTEKKEKKKKKEKKDKEKKDKD